MYAGQIPKINPTDMDTPTPMPIQYSDIRAGNSGTSRLINRVIRAAAATPHTPPSVVRVTASTTNWNRMFRLLPIGW